MPKIRPGWMIGYFIENEQVSESCMQEIHNGTKKHGPATV